MSSTTDNLSLFRFVIDQAPDGIIFADQQGVIWIWNNAAANLFGYLPEEAVGRTLDIIVPEDLRQAHWAGFRTAVASGHTKHGGGAMKTRATHKTGQKIYVSLAFSVVKDHDDKVLGAMAIAREFIADKTQ
jgi:PAS domain S-box-containing protein